MPRSRLLKNFTLHTDRKLQQTRSIIALHFACLWRLNLKNYAFAVATGLVLGFATVWWVRPDTNAGAVFIVVAVMLFVAGVIPTIAGLFRKSSASPSSAVKHDGIT